MGTQGPISFGTAEYYERTHDIRAPKEIEKISKTFCAICPDSVKAACDINFNCEFKKVFNHVDGVLCD